MCSGIAANLRRIKVKSENQDVNLANKRGKKRTKNKTTTDPEPALIGNSSDEDSHNFKPRNDSSPASNTRSKKRKMTVTNRQKDHSGDEKVNFNFECKKKISIKF